MLQLENITKTYKTNDFTQVALDNVSVSFRDNEFVAILGPSGSGKTTMLNIIGGLDHYDTGDLIIDGISTKNYKDRDWDTFRNNRVGFVFQSYNLIPHQTILANVELALTLSGVGKDERRKRAKEALEKVGLGEHINKRPSQLSGGQMQRVAIARALINDPEILLADEPTGALDSKTSVQIMDLLTEIADERLVVMVTHNPDLAEQYATRIVNLSDGCIVNDSDPFTPTPEDMRKSRKTVKRTSMSFLTALSLSFNNLMTKKGRTLMTAIAGSIGIIGIAAILALANGVSSYIHSVEEETLSVYPLEISNTGFDMTSMMTASMGGATQDSNSDEESDIGDAVDSVRSNIVDSRKGENKADTKGENGEGEIKQFDIVNRMVSNIGSNDLASLKEFLDSGESNIDEYTKNIQYSYDIKPQIYAADTSEGIDKINPDTSFSAIGIGSTESLSSLMSSMMTTDMFIEMMDRSIFEDQYDVVAGHWPENYNECVLVLTEDGAVSDFLLYVLGLRDHSELDNMIQQYFDGEEITTIIDDTTYTYDDFLNLKMKLVCAADYYQYDEEYGVWVDKSGDDSYVSNLIASGDDIVISGIVQPNGESSASALSYGIYYTPELTEHIVEKASETAIVQSQIDNPSVDVFNGKSFADEDEDSTSGFDMGSMFSVDTGALQAAFNIDTSKLNIDMTSLNVNFDSSSLPQPPPFDASSLAGASDAGAAASGSAAADAQVDMQAVALMMNDIMPAYQKWVMETGKSDVNEFLSDPSSGAAAIISQHTPAILAPVMQAQSEAMQQTMGVAMQAYMESYITELMGALTAQMQDVMRTVMTKAMSQIGENMASAMSIDEEAFIEAFKFNMNEDELTELIMSMMSSDEASYDSNLAKLNYADFAKPYSIEIYAKDFDAKQGVISIIDDYNDEMNNTGQEEKVVTYTDIVGTMMSSVTTIIDMISYVLIAFVSISLVVSSIMIGVITYISVLERKKEIGILRAIGASKFNISEVFNAETVIEGLISGVLGVGVTALICIPASAIIYSMFGVPNVASLPWQAGVALIIISVVLTFVAGLIPARSASKRDPVEALRSE